MLFSLKRHSNSKQRFCMRYTRRKNNEQIEHNTEHINEQGNEHIEHNTEHKTTGISDAPIYYKLKYEELSTEYKSLKEAHKSTIDELREEIKSIWQKKTRF